MRLLITDTNIFFDLMKTGLLPEFFSLEYEICTTSFVIGEVSKEKYPEQRAEIETFIRSGQLRVFEFSEEEIRSILKMETSVTLRRLTDRSVVWKAAELQCVMLTGDQKMRQVATEKGVETHGIIWVMDEIYSEQKLSAENTLDALQRLRMTNDWLPEKEIEKRITRFQRIIRERGE